MLKVHRGYKAIKHMRDNTPDMSDHLPEYRIQLHSEAYCNFRFSVSPDSNMVAWRNEVNAILSKHGMAVVVCYDVGFSSKEGVVPSLLSCQQHFSACTLFIAFSLPSHAAPHRTHLSLRFYRMSTFFIWELCTLCLTLLTRVEVFAAIAALLFGEDIDAIQFAGISCNVSTCAAAFFIKRFTRVIMQGALAAMDALGGALPDAASTASSRFQQLVGVCWVCSRSRFVYVLLPLLC